MALRIQVPKHDHIPTLPIYYHALQATQFLLAIIILGFAVYGVAYHSPFGTSGFMLFVSAATITVLTYSSLTLCKFPAWYNRFAVLLLECLLVVYWLSAFAALAAWTAGFDWVAQPVCGVVAGEASYCLMKRGMGAGPVLDMMRKGATGYGGLRRYRDTMAAAASLGALEFVLFVITLVVYSVVFHRMRLAGAPYAPNKPWTAAREPVVTPTGATMEAAISHPVAIIPDTASVPVEPEHLPPRIETIRTATPIAEQFTTLVERLPGGEDGFEEQKTYAGDAVEGGGRKVLRHSGTFSIE